MLLSIFVFCCLRAFASDSSRQLDILRHDGDSLGVDRAQVGVFEQANQVRFGRFLQGQDRGGLESQVSLEILGDFSDQSLERQLSDEQFRGLLVLADFSQRDGTRAVSVRLLDATSRRRGFARGLGRELLSRGFATCFFVFVRCCSKAREILVLEWFSKFVSTLSHQSVVFFDRWRLETNRENHPNNNNIERIDDGTTRARPTTKNHHHHHHRKKESEETRRFRRRRRRRPRVARVFATKRALLFRDGFPKCNTTTSTRRIVFESESKKDPRGTHAKEKHPFDSTEREREKREKREKSPPRRVAKKKNKTHRWIYEQFVWYEP